MPPKLMTTVLLGCSAALAQPASDPVLLFADCSDASQIRRVVQTSDLVEVRHSLAGDSQTCYAVSLTTAQGERVNGFLLGGVHPAVAAFDREVQARIREGLARTQGRIELRREPPKRAAAGAPGTNYLAEKGRRKPDLPAPSARR